MLQTLITDVLIVGVDIVEVTFSQDIDTSLFDPAWLYNVAQGNTTTDFDSQPASNVGRWAIPYNTWFDGQQWQIVGATPGCDGPPDGYMHT